MSNTNNRELYPEIHPYKESFIKGTIHTRFLSRSQETLMDSLSFFYMEAQVGELVLSKGGFLIQAITESFYLIKEVVEKATP